MLPQNCAQCELSLDTWDHGPTSSPRVQDITHNANAIGYMGPRPDVPHRASKTLLALSCDQTRTQLVSSLYLHLHTVALASPLVFIPHTQDAPRDTVASHAASTSSHILRSRVLMTNPPSLYRLLRQ
jgi:hypothetical protein